jgi:flagellar P-ring protein precursor FlgI
LYPSGVAALTGADGAVYAVAQGAIATSGYIAEGNAASVVEGVPTIAKVENGGIVEREVDFDLFKMDSIRIALRTPDFTTAARMRDVIAEQLGSSAVEVLDSGTVEVWVGDKGNVPETIMAVENLRLTPDTVARVVVDEKSGTIVMGADVRIAQVAISQGGLTVRVKESFSVSQPGPATIGGDITVRSHRSRLAALLWSSPKLKSTCRRSTQALPFCVAMSEVVRQNWTAC